jgi:hypothetical protein
MPVFPGIGLDFQPTQALQNFPQQAIALQQLGQQQRKQQAVMQLNQVPGMVESGLYTDKGLVALSQIDPAMRDQAVQKRAVVLEKQSQERKRQADEDKIRDKERQDGIDDDIMIPAIGAYESLKGASDEVRGQAMVKKINEEVDRMVADGRAKKYGMTDEQIARLRQWTSRDDIMLALMKHGKVGTANYLQEQTAERKKAELDKAESGGGVALSDVTKVDPTSGAITKPMENTPIGEGKPLEGPDDLRTAEGLRPSGEPDPDKQLPLGVAVSGETKIVGKDLIAPLITDDQNKPDREKDDFRAKAEKAESEAAKWRKVGGAVGEKRAKEQDAQAQQFWSKQQRQEEQEMKQQRIDLAVQRAKVTQEPLTPEAIDSIAYRYVKGDHQVTSGFARNQAAMHQFAEAIPRMAKKLGYSDDDINRMKMKFHAAAKTVDDFATGQPAKNITALNTAIGHMGLVSKLSEAMGSGDSRTINKALQAISTEFGNPNITNFNIARDAMSDELMRVFRQVGASENEAERWRKDFAAANTPQQIRQGLNVASHLLKSRINALEDQYTRGTGGEKIDVLSNEAGAAIKDIEDKTKIGTQNKKAKGIVTTPSQWTDEKEQRLQELRKKRDAAQSPQ